MRSFVTYTNHQIIIRMSKTRRVKLEVHVTRMGEKKNACRILIRYPEGKIPLGRA
jgi:hypothetical protein